ncbi:alpha/beta hydrolase [Puniceicoccus vermicola]|uniref:Alpha/beta hydrolase n=1 Tax=Puniceicoccus vermicola TaxID=388746 RepID=A0A7X1B173_9BACT|nr:alpha/beta hydrolase [Puniceicoccus vermicola]MBC2602610.1 alpha/beta hydrolase [Puniceicoccus vermicola]
MLSPLYSSQEAEIKPDQFEFYKTVDGKDFDLHIFTPEGHQPSDVRPAIVFFHGGAWRGGNPRSLYPQCRYLADRGMIAISVKYRVRSRDGTSPRECVMDANSAMRWVRANSDQLGINPDRIAAGGSSAGAQMAAATATTTKFNDPGDDPDIDCRPDALVLFNPVIDNGPGPDSFGHYWVADYWEDFSPLHNIDETTPPTIILVGSEDTASKPAACREFQRQMEAHDRRYDLLIYEGQTHGFYLKDPHYEEITNQAMARFLQSIGFIAESPN